MLYRVDINLNPGKSLNIFRKKLVNNTKEVMNIILPNITSSELIKEVRWLQKNSKTLIENGILEDSTNSGLVDFEVYENLRFVGARGMLVANGYVEHLELLPKIIDSKELNNKSPIYIDSEVDVRGLLRARKRGISSPQIEISKPSSKAIVGIGVAGLAVIGKK